MSPKFSLFFFFIISIILVQINAQGKKEKHGKPPLDPSKKRGGSSSKTVGEGFNLTPEDINVFNQDIQAYADVLKSQDEDVDFNEILKNQNQQAERFRLNPEEVGHFTGDILAYGRILKDSEQGTSKKSKRRQ